MIHAKIGLDLWIIAILLFISYKDFATHRIADSSVLGLLCLILLEWIITPPSFWIILNLIPVSIAACIQLLSKRYLIGWGDIKLLGCISLLVPPLFLDIFYIFFGLHVTGQWLLWFRLQKYKREFPLAPALCLTLIIIKVVLMMNYNFSIEVSC